MVVGGPRWVSQWATLAASHVRTDPEGSGAESHVYVSDEKGSTQNFLNLKNAMWHNVSPEQCLERTP